MSRSWRFALLGESISYSKSPGVFGAIGEYLHLDFGFEIRDLPRLCVPDELCRMRDGEIDGLSITIPHKETVCKYVDRCSCDAEAIGAVNCVVREDWKLIGHNTDWEGFLEPLFPLKSKLIDARVLILGSGGTARAAMYGLRTHMRVREFVVIARSVSRNMAVKTAAGETFIRQLTFDQVLPWKGVIDDCALIVNATPLGGSNYPDGSALLAAFTYRPDAVYYDLNYNDNNLLIQKAIASGGTAVDGKRMLVAQALKSFTLWTGLTVPFEPIYRKVFGIIHRQV